MQGRNAAPAQEHWNVTHTAFVVSYRLPQCVFIYKPHANHASWGKNVAGSSVKKILGFNTAVQKNNTHNTAKIANHKLGSEKRKKKNEKSQSS